jgi:CubicO group peptidase (beta-lactamase class C family)
VQRALTAELGDYAARNGLGVWFALKNETESFGAQVGVSDGAAKPATADDIIPAGSYAKPWTATAILRLVEAGRFSLDDPAGPLIDPFLTQNGTTVEDIWGPEFAYITVRDLLHMTSGLVSYNDTVIHNLTLSRPDWDITPNDYLALQRSDPRLLEISCACHTSPCSPKDKPSPRCCNATFGRVKCPSYNSINFLLLGAIVAAQSGGAWEAVDQKRAALHPFPWAVDEPDPDRAAGADFGGTAFYGRGLCGNKTLYPHNADFFDYARTPGAHQFDPVPMRNTSCLNGWAFGNVGTSATDAAAFFWRLLGERSLLNDTTVAAMRAFDAGQMLNMQSAEYGLGIWRVRSLSLRGHELNASAVPGPNASGRLAKYTAYEGHAGDDYGTVTRSGYHAGLGIAFSIGVNRWVGRWPEKGTDIHAVFCHVWKVLFRELRVDEAVPNATLAFNCSAWPPP